MSQETQNPHVEEFDPALPFIASQHTFNKFFETARANSVYGSPVRQGDTIIVPAAEILSIMGMGFGAGNGTEHEEKGQENNSGGGGGGGGRTFARPVAVIIANNDGVRVEHVFDYTKIALTAITATGIVAAMLMRVMNPKQALREMKKQ